MICGARHSLRNAIGLAGLALAGYWLATQAAAQMRPIEIPSLRAEPATFLMAIDQVVRSGQGTIAIGRIESGTVRVGDDIELVGFGPTLQVHVFAIDRFGRSVSRAEAGQSVGIRLHRGAPGEIVRGQVLAAPATVQSCAEFDAVVGPVRISRGGDADFRFRTATIGGSMIFTGPPGPGAGGRPVRIRVGTMAPLFPIQHFDIVRKGRAIGSGTVLRCRLGIGIGDDVDDNFQYGLVDGALVRNHGERDMNGLIAWILANRLGVARDHIAPQSRIAEDLKADRESVVRAIEEEMFVDISIEDAARIATVADAARAARRALDRPAG